MNVLGVSFPHIPWQRAQHVRIARLVVGSLLQSPQCARVPSRWSSGSRSHSPAWAPHQQSGTLKRAYSVPAPRGNPPEAVVLTFENIPRTYRDAKGLPFRKEPLTKAELRDIFGSAPTIHPEAADRFVRIVHGRRVAGTLGDPDLHRNAPPQLLRAYQRILKWLRKNVPVDETHCAGLRAEMELRAIDPEKYTNYDPHRLYVPNAPRPTEPDDSPYANGVFEGILKAREERKAEAERQKKELAEKSQQNRQERLGLPAVITGETKIQVAKKQPSARLQAYRERAKVLPDQPPNYSFFRRVGPTAAFTVVVVAALVAFTVLYEPSPHRFWPDIPPSAATVFGLMLCNVIVFCLWHHPPAFRMLNKYFVMIPGYPRVGAALGSIFSHQQPDHMIANMLLLWIAGTRLHEDIGRANFLALYVGAGVFGNLGSLAYYAWTKNFIVMSLGASGAAGGVAAAYLWLHLYEGFHIFGLLPPKDMPGIPAWLILACLVGFEASRAPLGKIRNSTVDIVNHLSGHAAGIAGMQALTWHAHRRRYQLAPGKHKEAGS